jgi:hypothetical protein
MLIKLQDKTFRAYQNTKLFNNVQGYTQIVRYNFYVLYFLVVYLLSTKIFMPNRKKKMRRLFYEHFFRVISIFDILLEVEFSRFKVIFCSTLSEFENFVLCELIWSL